MLLTTLSLISGGFDTLTVIRVERKGVIYMEIPRRLSGIEDLYGSFSTNVLTRPYIYYVDRGEVVEINTPLSIASEIDSRAFNRYVTKVVEDLLKGNPKYKNCASVGCPDCYSRCPSCRDGYKLSRCSCYFRPPDNCRHVCYYTQSPDNRYDPAIGDISRAEDHNSKADISWPDVDVRPTRGGLTVKTPIPVHIQIWSVLGTNVVDRRIEKATFIPLKPGIYFVKVGHLTRKVVVR